MVEVLGSYEDIQRSLAQSTAQSNIQRQQAYNTIVSSDDVNTGVEKAVKQYKPEYVAEAIDSIGLVNPEGNRVSGSDVVKDWQNYLQASNLQIQPSEETQYTISPYAQVPGLPDVTFGEVSEQAKKQGKAIYPPYPIDPIDEVDLPEESIEEPPQSLEANIIVPGLPDVVTGEVEQAAIAQGKQKPVFQLPEGVVPMYNVQRALLTGATKSQVIKAFGKPAYEQAISSIKKQAAQTMFVEPLKQRAGRDIFIEPELEKIRTASGEIYEVSQAQALQIDSVNRMLKTTKKPTGEIYALWDAIRQVDPTALLGSVETDTVTNYATGNAIVTYKDPNTGKPVNEAGVAKLAWKSLTPSQRLQVAQIWSGNEWKSNVFSEMSRQLAVEAESGGIPGQLVAAPVTGITIPIGKRASGQKVTPIEWVGAAATAAMDITGLGMISGVAPSSVSMTVARDAAIAGFGSVYINKWNDMSDAEKAIYGTILFAPSLLGPAIRTGQYVNTWSKGNYVPMRSMSQESSTMRVVLDSLEDARKSGIVSDNDILTAATDLNAQLVSGKPIAEVNLAGTTIRIVNSELQKTQEGLSIYSSMPDISLVDVGGNIPLFKRYWGSAKVAIEPLKRSYLEGVKATNPGIAEIRIPNASLVRDIMPQRQLISGGKILEPEMMIPSLEELQGMGYQLRPIPGNAGKAITFDAELGPIQIRRFTLDKVVENPTGLSEVRYNAPQNTGTIAIGDIHGTIKYDDVFNAINKGRSEPIISGVSDNPSTWHWAGQQQKVVVMGDTIDGGPAYEIWRETFNRLDTEAELTGGSIERLIGNHELAYLMNDAISGVKYTDATRKVIKAGLKEDIRNGKAKMAYANNNTLYTHAGLSSKVFPEYVNQSPEYIANAMNETLQQAVKSNWYHGKYFAKGRVEKGLGHSYKTTEMEQGGPLWLRPQEASISELNNLGFKQVVGHNPGWDIRRIWGDNFIEVDVGRKAGKTGAAYYDTPYLKTETVPIITESMGGKAPSIQSSVVEASLELKAMRDTMADFVLGWDGRRQAWRGFKESSKMLKEIEKQIQEQIKERQSVGDTIGVEYLRKQLRELKSQTVSDRVYGNIGYWRDLVMGRQNSVKVLSRIDRATVPELSSALEYIGGVRSSIMNTSPSNVEARFGIDRATISSVLDTSAISRTPDLSSQRPEIAQRLMSTINIVDNGIDRSVIPYINQNTIISEYENRLPVYRSQYATSEISSYSRIPSETIERVPIITPRGQRVPPSDYTIPTRGTLPRTPSLTTTRIPSEPLRVPTGVPRVPSQSQNIIHANLTPAQKKKYGIDDRGTIAWYQGQLNGQEIWYVVKYPYRTKDDVTRYVGVRPIGIDAPVSSTDPSYSSIQLITGTPPRELGLDLGIQDIMLKSPGPVGLSGTILYKNDSRRKTTNRINVKGVRSIRSAGISSIR